MSIQSPPAPPSDAPDWDAIEEDIHCPLCEYNLRGLTVPRCPECGYQFDWPELLDPTKRLHSYLFEHHPERNFKSFWQTAIGSLMPRTFWRKLRPQQPSNVRRLLQYALICMSCFCALFVAMFVVTGFGLRQEQLIEQKNFASFIAARASQPSLQARIAPYGSIDAYVKGVHGDDPWYVHWYRTLVERETLGLLTYVLLAPAIALLALFVFQASMRRAGAKHQHVLRCVGYSYDVSLWLGIFAVGYMIRLVVSAGWPPATIITPRYFGFIPLVGIAIGAYRLWVAYRTYLRFPHAFATVLAVQVIMLLLFMILDLEFFGVYL